MSHRLIGRRKSCVSNYPLDAHVDRKRLAIRPPVDQPTNGEHFDALCSIWIKVVSSPMTDCRCTRHSGRGFGLRPVVLPSYSSHRTTIKPFRRVANCSERNRMIPSLWSCENNWFYHFSCSKNKAISRKKCRFSCLSLDGKCCSSWCWWMQIGQMEPLPSVPVSPVDAYLWHTENESDCGRPRGSL